MGGIFRSKSPRVRSKRSQEFCNKLFEKKQPLKQGVYTRVFFQVVGL